MDLKSIELQIAVPRTSEATRIQQNEQSRPQIEQQFLADQHIKSNEQQRIRSNQVDESSKSTVREDSQQSLAGGQGHGRRSQDKSSDHTNEIHPAEHPFKGKNIDFSL